MRYAATYGDTWNAMSFRAGPEALTADAAELKTKMQRVCDDVGRDPSTLRHSFLMFDADARESGGYLFYWESVQQFADVAGQILALGFDEIGVYYPIDAQRDVFERVATEVMPSLRGPVNSRSKEISERDRSLGNVMKERATTESMLFHFDKTTIPRSRHTTSTLRQGRCCADGGAVKNFALKCGISPGSSAHFRPTPRRAPSLSEVHEIGRFHTRKLLDDGAWPPNRVVVHVFIGF